MSARRGVRIALHYAVLVLIALVCAFPFLWTLSVAIGTEGNVFSFPSSFIPRAASLANFIEVFRVIDLGRYFWNSIWITSWTVVWTILVPATMRLLGNANWWAPGPLAASTPTTASTKPTRPNSTPNAQQHGSDPAG